MEWMKGQVWRKLLSDRPELLHLFAPGNEQMLKAARAKHVRLDGALKRFGPPPADLVQELLNGGPTRLKPLTYDPRVVLTRNELQQFFADGYIHVRDAVPREVLDGALRHINACVGRGSLDRSLPELVGVKEGAMAQPVLDLFYESTLPTLVQCLLGRGKARPPIAGQVALRFPAATTSSRPLTGGRNWHVDGFGKGLHSPFTLLVGVCLSDVSAGPHAGNFAVHPGAHWTLQTAVKNAVASNDGVYSVHEFRADKPDLGAPAPLLMRPGDVVLAHQKLPHLGQQNYSPNIRYQVYFRVQHVDIDSHRELWLDDMMLPFEGVNAALAS